MKHVNQGFTFKLARPLNDEQYERLMDVPGCSPWYAQKTSVQCSVSTASVVQRELETIGAVITSGYLTVADPVDRDLTLGAFIAKTLLRGVYAWVWTSFAADFQKDACFDIAARRFNANLWAEPGSGKTFMACMSAAGSDASVIVDVTMPGVIKQTVDEWRRFAEWEVYEYRPVSRRRSTDTDIKTFTDAIPAWPDRPRVIVVGWDHLVDIERDIMYFMARGKAFVVWDEAQEGKNPKRKKWTMGQDGKLKALDLDTQSSVAARIAEHATYRLATTATTIDNALRDLWGQLTLVEPHAWGQTATRFLKRYCGATPNAFGGLDVDGMTRANLPELHERLAWSTVQIPYETSHGQLPPKKRQIMRVPIEEQIEHQGGLAREITKAEKEAATGNKDALHRSMTLRLQIASSRKRAAVVRGIVPYFTVGKGKVIVFSGMKRDCEDLAARIAKEGVDVFCSHGDDSVDTRNEVKDAYMAHPGPCVLVGTWHAWGTGFNLDDTDCIAFAMLPYRPKEIAQSEGRADRLSMKRPVMYLYFVAEGTIDERVVDIMLVKLEQVDAVTPGTRLNAFGGVARVLKGIDDVDALTAQMLRNMEAEDDLDAAWNEREGATDDV
jgi:superfamily II DNA or RNA helicase